MTAPSADPATREVRLFEPAAPLRRFAPSDVIRIVIGMVLLLGSLAVGAAAGSTVDGIEQDVLDGLDRLPDAAEQIIVGSLQIFATLVPLVALGVVLWRRRWRLLLHLWLTSLVAGLVLPLVLRLLGDRESATGAAPRSVRPESVPIASDFPTTSYLATSVATVTFAVAYLPRRWRRAAWIWISLLIALRFLGPGQPPLDILIAFAVGTIVGSLALLVLGSPTNEPTPAQVLEGVRSTGVEPVSIERASETAGSMHYVAREADGRGAFVKMRTPDDRSWDLLNRAYQAVRLRSTEWTRPYSTLKRRVEHEALAIRTVRDGGAAAPQVVGVGTTSNGAVLLVEELVEGPRLSSLDGDRFDDALVRSFFDQIARMHATRTAHHHLTLDNFALDADGRVRPLDFDDAELASSDRERARDIAEALVAIGTVAGPERPVAIAVDVLGARPVAASLPLLQPLALSPHLGREIKRQKGLLDDLRAEIHVRTGADDVPLEQLARIRPRTLMMTIAGALAFYSLLPQFGNLDDTVDAFGDIRWAWVPGLVGAAAIYYVFATISFLGSVAQPMPIAPSARSQVATSFAQLVGPAGSGKMALAGRFLQRNGLTGSEAGASVALNTIAGVVTHLSLMVAFFAWAGGADIGGISLPSLGTVLLVGAAAVALFGIAFAVPYTRRRLVMPVVDGLRTAAGYSAQVVRSPTRVAGLLGGSTFITLSYLIGAVCAVEAFGGGITFAQVGASYLGAAAIANIAPTPGGIGPLEAAMIAGFTGFGLDAGVAISAVLTFRLATFWLPIVPGWATFMWMERRNEI